MRGQGGHQGAQELPDTPHAEYLSQQTREEDWEKGACLHVCPQQSKGEGKRRDYMEVKKVIVFLRSGKKER